MKVARSVADVRREVAAIRERGAGVGFVPTMGALHAGHGSLVERALAGGRAVLSIFVNPLQFGPGEDYASYPRDLERDLDLARSWGVTVVFAPDAAELLPCEPRVQVDPGPLGAELEGRVRPGHFRGVLTIVAKLLNVVAPDVAVFGRKDLQQAVLVRMMARDLSFAARIEVAPTVRDDDGLALSSRNAHLSPAERARAPALYRALQAGERLVRAGERSPEAVGGEMLRVLRETPGVEPDYAVALREEDLSEPAEIRGPTALAVAARVGATRLIDNLPVEPPALPRRPEPEEEDA